MDVWSRYQGQALSAKDLDTALGAFDMFVLHDQTQDLDYVCLSPVEEIARRLTQHVSRS